MFSCDALFFLVQSVVWHSPCKRFYVSTLCQCDFLAAQSFIRTTSSHLPWLIGNSTSKRSTWRWHLSCQLCQPSCIFYLHQQTTFAQQLYPVLVRVFACSSHDWSLLCHIFKICFISFDILRKFHKYQGSLSSVVPYNCLYIEILFLRYPFGVFILTSSLQYQ